MKPSLGDLAFSDSSVNAASAQPQIKTQLPYPKKVTVQRLVKAATGLAKPNGSDVLDEFAEVVTGRLLTDPADQTADI